MERPPCPAETSLGTRLAGDQLGWKPRPLPVWDRRAGKLVQEFMDDHPAIYAAIYDTRPRRSMTQWLESRRLNDWLIAAYQNGHWSTRGSGYLDQAIDQIPDDAASSGRLDEVVGAIVRSGTSADAQLRLVHGEDCCDEDLRAVLAWIAATTGPM
jgi:hypothetical protein